MAPCACACDCTTVTPTPVASSTAAAYRSFLFISVLSAVREQPGEVRVAGGHVDLSPESVIVEGRGRATVEVGLELRVVRVVLVEGPDVEEGHSRLDLVAVRHLAAPARRDVEALAGGRVVAVVHPVVVAP